MNADQDGPKVGDKGRQLLQVLLYLQLMERQLPGTNVLPVSALDFKAHFVELVFTVGDGIVIACKRNYSLCVFIPEKQLHGSEMNF